MKRSPVIKQILIFGILSAVISLLLACAGFGVVEFFKIKNEAIRKATSQMDILAYSLQPTLVFDDKEAADKILRALEEDKSVNKIRIFRNDGREFASLISKSEEGNIRLSKDIVYDRKLIGRLEIESVYIGIEDRIKAYLWISLLIILLSIPASYFISAPIRQQVSSGVVQLEQQTNRLRMLADQVAATEQKERKRIAAIIHDHLQQLLVAGKLQLAQVTRELGRKEFEKAGASVTRVGEFLDEATRAARTLTVELRPPVLYEDGLGAAFQWLANKFKADHRLSVTLDMDEVPGKLPDTLKIMIFESVKEMLLNVVKYSGVQEAQLSLRYNKEYLNVTVKDSGHGFETYPAELRPSDRGFGLFSIRERLKLLNGELKIASRPNQGTEVTMVIPVDWIDESLQKPQVAWDKQSVNSLSTSRTIKILLADDHKIVREGLANLLKENPAFDVVAQAENGQEAVEKSEIFMPDVVIMDINMPKLNGIEATRIIKRSFPKISVIGLSVQNEEYVVDSMKKAGATALLNKAGDSQELVKLILKHMPVDNA
jgi:signal transduction histidine kinase